MSIDRLGRPATTKGPKSLKKNKTDGRSLSAKAGENTAQIETHKHNRAALNGAAMIIAGACLLAPDYSFATDSSGDLAAEVERLRKELGETKKENDQLKKAVSNSNVGTAANAAPAQPVPAATTAVATAEPPKKKRNLSMTNPRICRKSS